VTTGSLTLQGSIFEPPGLQCKRPRLDFEPLFYFNAHADPDLVFHSNADPDPAFKNNADPFGSRIRNPSWDLTYHQIFVSASCTGTRGRTRYRTPDLGTPSLK
jgi:hypothetical protein